MIDEKLKILIVDADEVSRNYLSKKLYRGGLEIFLAASGREALVAAWQNLPNLLIVDPDLPDMSGVDLIGKLRQDHRTESLRAVVLNTSDKQEDMDEYLSAGFDEYIIKSGETIQKLLDIIPEKTTKSKESQQDGLLIAVISAKGGVGTSSLCANIAMCTGSMNKRPEVVVVDLVLPIGSLASIVGYDGSQNIVNISTQDDGDVFAALTKENLPRIKGWKFHLLAGSPDPDSNNQLNVERIPAMIKFLRKNYDYVFVDLGRSLSHICLPIILHSDILVIVLATDQANLAITQTVWSYLSSKGFPADRVYPVLNRAVGLEGVTKLEAERILGLQIRVTVPYMGGNLALANNRHEPVAAKFPTDAATFSLQQIAQQLNEFGDSLRAG